MAATALASAANLLRNLLEYYGQDPSTLLDSAGHAPDLPRDPHARLPADSLDRLWAKAAELIPDPCFGLQAARCWHPSHLGALGYAWLASSTLHTALERLERYVRLVDPWTKVQLKETDAGLEVILTLQSHQEPETPAIADASLALILDLCRVNYGAALDPLRVTFRHPEPPCRDRHEGFFRCPVHFSATEDSLTLPLDAVDEPLPSANAELARIHDKAVLKALARLDRNDVVTRTQVAIIDQLPSGNVTEHTVASALNLSQRTLHRRLIDEATSFGQLLEAIRRDLADKYLADSTISLAEISYLLGFAEQSSFSRAFKRWTGRSPREMRRQA